MIVEICQRARNDEERAEQRGEREGAPRPRQHLARQLSKCAIGGGQSEQAALADVYPSHNARLSIPVVRSDEVEMEAPVATEWKRPGPLSRRRQIPPHAAVKTSTKLSSRRQLPLTQIKSIMKDWHLRSVDHARRPRHGGVAA
jgi:hypothetical protein